MYLYFMENNTDQNSLGLLTQLKICINEINKTLHIHISPVKNNIDRVNP